MSEQATEIVIQSFHPLSITLPEGDTLQGKVRIVLPEVHVKVFDLSMGGIIPGAHLGSDAPMVGYNIEFSEPVEVGELMKFVIKSADLFEQVWEAYQAETDLYITREQERQLVRLLKWAAEQHRRVP